MEGLLSTGPTPSSFKCNLKCFNQFKKYTARSCISRVCSPLAANSEGQEDRMEVKIAVVTGL